jgi:membrane associated rhomboid family serine protease
MAATEPALNVPRSVAGVAVLLAAMQIVRDLLPDEMDLTLLLALAFIPARYSGAALELPGGYLTAVTSFVTYMLVHAGWVHLLANLLWMLAFGSAVARRMGGRDFLLFSVICGIAGALTHLLLHYGDMAPVIGASAAISGQMAGALRFIFKARRLPGEETADLMHAPPMSLMETFTDKRMLAFLAFWVALNAYFGLSAVRIAGEQGSIAWEAHIGGFLCGLLIFGAFDKGGAAGLSTPNQA